MAVLVTSIAALACYHHSAQCWIVFGVAVARFLAHAAQADTSQLPSLESAPHE
jgi:hypothetical protein